MPKPQNYCEKNPEEAARIEADILTRIEHHKNVGGDWDNGVHALYPTPEDWENNPDRYSSFMTFMRETGLGLDVK